jgi:alpha-glucan, water dikinase
MKTTETITTRSGLQLQVETCRGGDGVEVSLRAPLAKRCLLHWGVRQPTDEQWRVPPQPFWPPGTMPAGQNAVQTPFAKQNGQAGVSIRLSPPSAYASLDFVLFFPDEGRWDNNGGRNYQIQLGTTARPAGAALAALRAQLGTESAVLERVFNIAGSGQLAVAVTKTEDRYAVLLVSDIPGPLLLHWGIARRSPHEWLMPPETMRGPNTVVSQSQTAQTPFADPNDFNSLRLEFPVAEAPLGLAFVLKQGGESGRWLKHAGANFYVPVQVGFAPPVALGAAELTGLADEIIRAEMEHNSWTLMHRFNLCYDLLDRVRNNADGQALLYVWLRFSAIRQLTWQRNFNTKPRELAHAQDRLTQKLAEVYRLEPGSRPLARLALATVGRGGEGQQIRDEILNIMHRHHVKEVSGHFLEEWHQKLHNNTTPDDVVICEAYLEFLRSNGNRDRFYQTLEAGGVTRQRLESFERPIRSQPDFVPHLKDGLLHDFEHFLTILKASHSGTDLETAINAARGQLDGDFQGLLHHLWNTRNAPAEGLVGLVNQITDARRRVSNQLHHQNGLRELLYLDLALEQLLRGAVERNIHLSLNGDQLVDLITRLLENVALSYEDPELAACSRHWERLQALPRFGAEWSLHAKSVVDRITRALSAWIDRFYHLLQPKAEYLGHGFQAENWTITLFSEEVVRGNSLGFVLSLLLHHLDPILRQAAHIGSWQIISRGPGGLGGLGGKVEVVDSLRAIQRQRFEGPTVIVAEQVMGDEDIPEGVVAVIAPDVTDVVSHVAVRARNAGVLFASCHDPGLLQRLKSLRGHHLRLKVSSGGDVLVEETAGETPTAAPAPRPARPAIAAPRFARYAVALADFNDKIVGGKSCHQAKLRGQLPDWISLPSSVALPFGVCEKVLGLDLNHEVASRYQELVQQAQAGEAEKLAALRETVLKLAAPEELKTELREVMGHAGLAWPDDWTKAWTRIKQVWASKWNDRAFLSRRKIGLAHSDLFMAVLIQQVVPADYAFVIHTVNPSTGKANKLFAEVVLGLGETLVGNYPGRALSFVFDKSAGMETVLSHPSKGIGLYGSGLIFRSDSNGEDLAGYAGAGLYDSVLLDEPRSVALDYTQEPLVWDEAFRHGLLTAIARIGLEVERACGSPQDIEGAVTQGQYYVVQTRPQVGVETPNQT